MCCIEKKFQASISGLLAVGCVASFRCRFYAIQRARSYGRLQETPARDHARIIYQTPGRAGVGVKNSFENPRVVTEWPI